jgi:hypothetical protein
MGRKQGQGNAKYLEQGAGVCTLFKPNPCDKGRSKLGQVPLKLPFSNYVKAHHISHAALSCGALMAAIVFFAAGAVVRLLVGPVSLGPLQQSLAGAIQNALPGITLAYDKAGIEWDREQDRIELVVLGTRILDQDGKVVASAPKADIDLAALSLFKGKVAVQRITLIGVSFRLVHMKDGGIRLGAEGEKANDVYARLYDLINKKGTGASSLKSFAVRDANLKLYDEVTGLNLSAPRANLSITARAANLITSFSADVNVSGKPAHVAADMVLPAGSGPISGTASIQHLDLSALAANAPLFRPLRLLPLSTSLSTRFALVPGGHVSQTDFDLEAKGDVPWSSLTSQALHVRELRLTGHYDGTRNHLSLTQASMDSKEADVRLKGGADFIFANGELDSIVPDISTIRAAFDMPGVFPGPVALQSAAFRGRWHATARSFDVERLDVSAPQFALSAKGTVQLGDPGQAPGLMLSATIQPIAARTLLRYWPVQVAGGAREWIDANIFAGQMGPISIQTSFTPGMLDQPVLPDEALRLSFPLSGVEGNYVAGLTHLTGVAGTATLTGDTFSADFSSGKVGLLTVSRGHALIPTLHVRGTTGEFSAHVEGAMPDVMTLIDMKPLGYPTRFGVDPRQTTGNANIDLTIRVPMLNSVKTDDIGINVKADVANYGVVLGKLHFTNGDVEFNIDNDQLRQTGAVNLADSRLNVDWTEDLKTSGDPITTRLAVRGQITDAGRAALNIGLGNILTGPVGVTATLQGHRGNLRAADAQLDLTPANILIPIIHLNKPAGQAAAGRVLVNFGAGDNISDETIRLTGPTLAANGTASFDGKGVLTQLNFPSVRLGTLNDFSFMLAKSPQGDTYTLRGHSMDGSLVGRNGSTTPSSPGANASTPPPDETPNGAFHIDAKLDRVAMRDGIALAPFSMDLAGVGNRPGALALSATLTQTGLARTAPLTASVTQTAQGRQLVLNAGDAGMLIRGMFAFESLRGGKMNLTATMLGPANSSVDNNPDYSGRLEITDFNMVNQPFLSRLFSAVSFTGVADLLGGNGISVDKLDVPFTSKNSVISIKDSVVSGTVGGTADGYIDRPKNQVALKGTLVPAYGLNSLISNIPVIGDILASKKGEGIIGVTYSATGNADQPNISTNPLSALTPGILRRIFEGRMPNAASAPSNTQGVPGANIVGSGSGAPVPPANPPQTVQSAIPTPTPRPEQ